MLYSHYLQFAKPFDGAIATILDLQEKGFTVNIVSHKTKFPYVGEKINLIEMSRKWIQHNLVSEANQPLIEEKQILFTETIDDKISAIIEIKAVVFIDDLKKVLNELPVHIEKIWFNPNSDTQESDSCKNWIEIRNKIWSMNLI